MIPFTLERPREAYGSYDDGQNWQTFTDELTNIGISDLAIDPLNPNIMYLATGDRDAGDTYSFGLMKSTDGGVTWSTTGLSFGLSNSYKIGRVVVHPTSTNIVVAATNAGIYRSTNYGQTFVLERRAIPYVQMGQGNTLFATTSADQVSKSTAQRMQGLTVLINQRASNNRKVSLRSCRGKYSGTCLCGLWK